MVFILLRKDNLEVQKEGEVHKREFQTYRNKLFSQKAVLKYGQDTPRSTT